MNNVEQTAQLLLERRHSQATMANIPAEIRPVSQPDAYAAQDLLVADLLRERGGGLVGHKVACTSEHAQRLLSVSGPFTGRLLAATTHTSPATLPAHAFNLRVIEPEFAFVLAADVPRPNIPYDAASILPFLGDFRPAIEVVDHRYDDFTVVGEYPLIADNAIHGACVLGEPVANWQNLDLAAHPVQLSVNGALYDTGSGANVLGHPLNVMAWLANDLERRGQALHAGDIVITGVATKTYRAQAGDAVTVDFGPLGTVAVSFA